jgi:DNA-directed RNA polymerase alpha subunit
MLPSVNKVSDKNGVLTFTLSNVNVSLANSIRRTILSDIPTVVFKTTPYPENKSKFIVNTTRLNNEILKQRLSCIPIHITDFEIPLEDYLLEVNVANLTDTIQYVTTQDFKVKNIKTGEFLKDKDNEAIFPKNQLTNSYIDFARLRPRISDEISGEKLSFTCEFSVSTAKDDYMFNVVSTCSYGFTTDPENIEIELEKQVQKWKDQEMNKENIEFEKKNWRLLEGNRIVKPNSFDFIIESVGVYDNKDIVKKSCYILINKFTELNKTIDEVELSILPSENTMKNSYDVILVNEDYTIGKVIEYMLYSKFFEGLKILTFCGFKKMHPHDTDSIVRLAYKESVDLNIIKQNLKQCIDDSINIYQLIYDKF